MMKVSLLFCDFCSSALLNKLVAITFSLLTSMTPFTKKTTPKTGGVLNAAMQLSASAPVITDKYLFLPDRLSHSLTSRILNSPINHRGRVIIMRKLNISQMAIPDTILKMGMVTCTFIVELDTSAVI